MAQHPSYDYIVVGAGSAGAVVASRLSEDPSTSVLLLEAGPDNDALEIAMPAAFANLFKTRWDWDYTTTPQPGLGGQRAYWPRMKALGGCSSMNAMMYVRGARADFDGWQRDFGAVGWSYADVLPYFMRGEANSRGADAFHGADGPLHVEALASAAAIDFIEEPSLATARAETMMMGLRLNAGVPNDEFHSRFGRSIAEAFPQAVDDCLALELLEWHDDSLRLTEYGRLLGNEAFHRFLAPPT